jgi:hypothetical protein
MPVEFAEQMRGLDDARGVVHAADSIGSVPVPRTARGTLGMLAP